MRALTIRQPWAWAIVHGGKNVENRIWATPYRGPLLIHAGAKDTTWAEIHRVVKLAGERFTGALEFGAIIGVAELVDVHSATRCYQEEELMVQQSRLAVTSVPSFCSTWAAESQYHWVLRDPRPIKPVPIRGRQQLWIPPEEVLATIRKLLNG